MPPPEVGRERAEHNQYWYSDATIAALVAAALELATREAATAAPDAAAGSDSANAGGAAAGRGSPAINPGPGRGQLGFCSPFPARQRAVRPL